MLNQRKSALELFDFEFLLFLIIIILFSHTSYSQDCGKERWAVKTLSDEDTNRIDFSRIIRSTVHEQISLPKCSHNKRRLSSETLVYAIDCLVVGFKRESEDKDIHVIIRDATTNETMVAEILGYECAAVQQTGRAKQFKQLHDWFIENIGHSTSKFVYLQEPIPVRITGVGFFDFIHGQKGMASNGREIHPVLSMRLLNNLHDDNQQQVITLAAVNLRKTPGSSGAVVTVIPKGTLLNLNGCISSWCKVSFKGYSGYLNSNFVGIPSNTLINPVGGKVIEEVSSKKSTASVGLSVESSIDNSIPAGATAECRDGSYSFSTNRRGTCSQRGGVKRWLH
jgi:uncharacterized protein YraI